MFANLSQREKIMVYVLLALLGIFVLYKYVWLIQSEIYKQAKTDYDALSIKANGYRNSIQTLANLKKEEIELQKRLLEVTQPYKIDIMGGEQVREIGQIIESAGLKVEAAAPINTVDAKVYYLQEIKFLVNGPYGALEQFFFDTEYSKYAFIIKNFDITPKVDAGVDPSIIGLNYNNLKADLVVTVIADKDTKVEEPVLQSLKFDLFKPTDADMQAMRHIEQAKAAENAPPLTGQDNVSVPTVVNEAPSVSHEDDKPAQDYIVEDADIKQDEAKDGKYKVSPKADGQEYKLNYSFQKK